MSAGARTARRRERIPWVTTATWAKLLGMANVDELVDAARRFVDDIVGLANEMLGAGMDAERIHQRYVAAASI